MIVDDKEHSIQFRLYLENSSKAIAPVLPTKEPEYSLSMGDEHLNIILETESDELKKSSAENLVLIPSEFEDTSDNENPHYFNAESNLLESLLNRDTLIDSSPKFDFLLEEFFGELAHIDPIPSGIKEADFDLEEEIQEIDLFLDTDDLMPPGSENDDYDSEGDIHFLEELLSNDSFPLPENESSSFDYHNNPSFPRPPLEPSDVEFFFDFKPNTGVLTTKVMKGISEHYVLMPNILPTFSNLDPNLDFTPSHDSLRSKNKIFDLGIFIEVQSERLLSQEKFFYLIHPVKTASTPIKTKKYLVKDEEAVDVDVHLYRSMIDSLMYLTASRPDIMYVVCACSRFQVTPKTSYLQVVKRIFRYLKGQPKLGLWYPKESDIDLEAYSDSDYAGANLDRKSTTGGCQFLGRRLISWRCKKQTIVATSTTEAEYVAAASCCGQVLWIQNQMLDYGFNFISTKIYIDNESTTCIVKNIVFYSKTKHIEIRHHFIRDAYEKKLIQVLKIHTDDNVADLLTKAFDVSRLQLKEVWLELKSCCWYEAYTSCCQQKSQCCSSYTYNCQLKVNVARLKLTTARVYAAEVRFQALVDGKRVKIKESYIRRTLRLDDAEGTSCLTNIEIFEGLAKMGAKTTSWNEFSSTMAFAIICLTTNQKFNFSRYILLSLVKNIEAGVPFFMFPRYLQADAQSIPITIEPLTSKPQKKHKPKRKHTQESKVPPSEQNLPSPSNDPLPSGEDSLKLKELMDLCTNLSNKVLELESMVINIKSTYQERIEKLEGRVERLEEENRVLKELKSVLSTNDADEPVMEKEKSSKQRRKIADIDADVDINLEKAQAEAYKLDLDHQEKVLSMMDVNKEEPADVEEVMEVVKAAKLMTEVVITARATKVSVPRKRRGVIIQDPEETTTTATVQPKVQAKDKGNAILIEEPKPLKRQAQIELDEEVARQREAELNADIN
nr:putative ribonuclease H-like domain-containing protein [Tanacetum cinerariifolium]